jgi:hypothetical protein
MGSIEEVENEIWACNYALEHMIKLNPSHPDYTEYTKAQKIILNKIKKLQENLKKIKN